MMWNKYFGKGVFVDKHTKTYGYGIRLFFLHITYVFSNINIQKMEWLQIDLGII